MKITFDTAVDIVLFCSYCDEELIGTDGQDYGFGTVIKVDACPQCIADAKEEAHADGVKEGYTSKEE